jgi:hypothetical protein
LKICIVGHGPSVVGRKLGRIIDSHDYVVRMKNCAGTIGSEDYGERTDAICFSADVLGLTGRTNALTHWVYCKSGNYDRELLCKVMEETGASMALPLKVTNYWNGKFRDMGATHPNMSTGLAAIVIAASYAQPETLDRLQQITLVGFDTLLDPTVPFTRNDAIPRTGAGDIDHDWQTENKLLKVIADTYSFDIAKL